MNAVKKPIVQKVMNTIQVMITLIRNFEVLKTSR